MLDFFLVGPLLDCMHTATANGIISLARPWGVLVHIMAYLTHQKYYQIVTSKENEASADFWTEGIYSNPWEGQRHLVYLHPAHAVQRPARWSCPSLTLRRRVLKELLQQAAGRFFQTWWLSMPSTLSFFSLDSQSNSSWETSQKTPIPNPPTKNTKKTRHFCLQDVIRNGFQITFSHESCFSPRFGIQSLVQGAPGAVVLAKNWRCYCIQKDQ